jgi:hypothetical protein
MPAIHYQPMALIDGLKGCGGCHSIGLKRSLTKIREEAAAIRAGHGGKRAPARPATPGKGPSTRAP